MGKASSKYKDALTGDSRNGSEKQQSKQQSKPQNKSNGNKPPAKSTTDFKFVETEGAKCVGCGEDGHFFCKKYKKHDKEYAGRNCPKTLTGKALNQALTKERTRLNIN